MIAKLHAAVTGRRGFVIFLTSVLVAACVLRILFPNAPSNDDVKEQLWMSVDWRLGYGSGANPPLFTWLVKIVTAAVGSTLAAVELVRFALLWTFCMLSAHVVRVMTGDARLAPLAGLAPLAVFAVGWEGLFRHSNTMLLIVSIPMTIAALLRLDRRGDWTGYLMFAAASAFGFYSKYNYAIVWLGLCAAALMDSRLRARLLHPRMIAALLVALLLLSPVLYWAVEHFDAMLGHGRLRLNMRPTYSAVPAVVSALMDLVAAVAGLILPLFAILLVLCPRAFLPAIPVDDGDRSRWHGVLVRYLLTVAAVLVASVFVFGMAHFQTRYVYVMVPVLTLAFLRLAAAELGERRQQWLAATLVVVILLVIAGAALRGVTYAARKASAAPARPACTAAMPQSCPAPGQKTPAAAPPG